MIYNNDNKAIKVELKKLLIDEQLTFTEVANRLSISKNQLNDSFNKVNFSFKDLFKMLDSIGYDLQLEFVKRD